MYQLYYAPDNASLIIKILLEELGEEYETILVDRSIEQQKSVEYKKLNPNGFIPTCIIDDEPVFETAAILLTLAEKHQRFFPQAGGFQRTYALKWLFFISNNIHADLRQLFYYPQYIGKNVDSSLHRQLNKERLHQQFSIINDAYQQSEGDYFLGESLSIIDIYLSLCLRWSQIYPSAFPKQINPSDYPELYEMLKVIEQRPAVIKACSSEGLPPLFFSEAGYIDPSYGRAL